MIIQHVLVPSVAGIRECRNSTEFRCGRRCWTGDCVAEVLQDVLGQFMEYSGSKECRIADSVNATAVQLHARLLQLRLLSLSLLPYTRKNPMHDDPLRNSQDMRQLCFFACGGGCESSCSCQALDSSPTRSRAPQRSSDMHAPAIPSITSSMQYFAETNVCTC